MDKLVTIIVPVYNVKKYLEACVLSIINQSYRSIEIILVDDGSFDDSGSICDRLACRDGRIRVIHKKNGGLSDARNVGLELAQGYYIVFCDSDDWMEEDIIKSAVSNIEYMNVQMVVWGFSADFENDDGSIRKSTYSKASIILDDRELNMFSNKEIQGLLGYAWNKLYLFSTISANRDKFEVGTSLVEDVLFNSKIIRNCKRIALIDKIGTHYMQRNAATLGNAFYPNYAELIIRAIRSKRSILEHFNCPLNVINLIIGEYAMLALKVGVLGITKKHSMSFIEKSDRLRLISTNIEMDEILRIAKPCGLKEKMLIRLMKAKVYDLIVMFA